MTWTMLVCGYRNGSLCDQNHKTKKWLWNSPCIDYKCQVRYKYMNRWLNEYIIFCEYKMKGFFKPLKMHLLHPVWRGERSKWLHCGGFSGFLNADFFSLLNSVFRLQYLVTVWCSSGQYLGLNYDCCTFQWRCVAKLKCCIYTTTYCPSQKTCNALATF